MCESEQTQIPFDGYVDYPDVLTRKWSLKFLAHVGTHLATREEIAFEDLGAFTSVFSRVYCGPCDSYAVLCDECDHCAECCEGTVCSSCDTKRHDTCSRCSECSDCCNCAHCSHCGGARESVCEHCERCLNCCSCVICALCNSECSDSYCSSCERCSDCCNCTFCGNCGESVDSTCGECNCCNGCCDCSKGPRARQSFRKVIPETLAGYKQNRLKRLTAIELELCSVGDSDSLLSYARKSGSGLVSDGSIGDAGVEINTNPACGDAFLADIRALVAAVKNSDGEVNDNCGLHVHIDASDYSQHDLKRLMLLWVAVEPSMFELVSRSRVANTYCLPSGEKYVALLTAEDSQQNWRQKLAAGLYNCAPRAAQNEKSDKYHKSRYYALNLHSFFFRKTIEIRLHEARTDADVLEHWPLICAHIVDKAFKSTESQLIQLLQSEQTAEEILLSCLPESVRNWTINRLRIRRQARMTHHTLEMTNEQVNALKEARASFDPSRMHRDMKHKQVPVKNTEETCVA